MPIEPLVRDVFGGFQSLNLAVLMRDLRQGDTVRGAWSSLDDNRSLCPVSHGMADGDLVGQLRWATQAVDIERACVLAARHLGTQPISVFRFVQLWDSFGAASRWLLAQLEELWAERLTDADTVQEILEPLAGACNGPDEEEAPGTAAASPPLLRLYTGEESGRNGGSVWESNPPRA
jgi:hypothetical protein